MLSICPPLPEPKAYTSAPNEHSHFTDFETVYKMKSICSVHVMRGEWVRIVKEATVIYVEVLSGHSSG